MALFYLNTTTKEAAGHQVHREKCPHIADRANRMYIGSYSNPQAAMYDIKMHYPGTTYCPECIKS